MRAAIVLAAGASRRFGRADKLKVQLRGRSLLEHAIENARASGARRIVLVTSKAAHFPGVRGVRARGADKGLSASLAAGLRALRPIEREAYIFLADMPFARASGVGIPSNFDAVRPCFDGVPGHPMLVRVKSAKAALGHGDSGLAGRLRCAVVRGALGTIIDIDTAMGLRRARLYGSRAFRQRSGKG